MLMHLHGFLKFLPALLAVSLLVLSSPTFAGDTNAVAGTNAVASTNAGALAEGAAAEAAIVGAQDTLRSNLQVQSQLHDAQILIEQSRQEAAAAARAAELLNQRLDTLASSLATERLQTLKDIQRSNQDMQHSNQLVLIIAGGLAGFAILVLMFAAYVQWNLVARVAGLASQLRGARALEAGEFPAAFGISDNPLPPSPALQQSTANFLGVLDRLEKRIHDMSIAQMHPSGAELHPENGAKAESHTAEPKPAVTVLLGKGQTLLKLDQGEAALACFDEALALDPSNGEALLQKGAALERLQRLNEAIDCYDRAIATDSSMTMAYLHKGGVYNRMERYSEALECYEKALRTQDKGRPADTITE